MLFSLFYIQIVLLLEYQFTSEKDVGAMSSEFTCTNLVIEWFKSLVSHLTWEINIFSLFL